MTGLKTNERPGTRAVVKDARMSAYKARQVLDLIRGKEAAVARDILRYTERDAATVIGKCLESAIANAEHNDHLPEDELFVSACFADEGKTLRRFRPRARGRATRIRKRSCHITIIVSRLSEADLEKRRQREANRPGSRAARRAGQEAAEERRGIRRRRRAAAETHDHDHEHDHDHAEQAAAVEEQGIVDQQAVEVAQVEAAESQEQDVSETTGTDDAGAEGAAAEEGIVDQQDAALAQMDDDAAGEGADDAAGTGEKEEDK